MSEFDDLLERAPDVQIGGQPPCTCGTCLWIREAAAVIRKLEKHRELTRDRDELRARVAELERVAGARLKGQRAPHGGTQSRGGTPPSPLG